ncbi:GlpG-like proten [Dichelobacter nodosus VCS1703A]|uniref:GlpG-like proten n=2 Tax=Dichelobacter nodosus TaxID=870 RepID=A5EX27_DICNV|nr:GlpG-like proten [Dichelobacter nodosus VCS1703A]
MFHSPILKRAGVITWIVFALCFGFTLLIRAGYSPLTRWFLFYPEAIKHGQIWRIITPAFLHFSMLGSVFVHLLFNTTIWLNLASAIESHERSSRLAGLFFFSAISSNIIAYLSYSSAFGGLSGVVYALIGYIGMRGRFDVYYQTILPPSMIRVFIGFMLIGYTGLFGVMANNAHLSGFFAGVLYAYGSGKRFRRFKNECR